MVASVRSPLRDQWIVSRQTTFASTGGTIGGQVPKRTIKSPWRWTKHSKTIYNGRCTRPHTYSIYRKQLPHQCHKLLIDMFILISSVILFPFEVLVGRIPNADEGDSPETSKGHEWRRAPSWIRRQCRCVFYLHKGWEMYF